MSMITTINDQIKLELRPGLDGFGVDSIVNTNFGGTACNQVFWHQDEAVARAFISGVQMAAVLLR